MTVLNHSFFSGSTVEVARKLIGKVLCRRSGNLLMKCRLVEVEAYLADGHGACHAAKRKTPRNEVMFGSAGLVYVYSIHARYCMNFVTEKAGLGCAVLVRAAEPLLGLEEMARARGTDRNTAWLSGPGKLCQALGVDRELNGISLSPKLGLWVEDDGWQCGPRQIRSTPRIGVTAAQKKRLRYVLRNSPYASGPKYLR